MNISKTVDHNLTISACMIVKNEEKRLPECLESIKDVVDEIIIVDTGSSDNTINIARRYGARLYEHPWENHFSRHRNQSIGYATCDWIFIIDADEVLVYEDGQKFRELFDTCQDVDGILVRIESKSKGGGEGVHNSIRFFKNHLNIHYKGRVHNEIRGAGTVKHIPIKILHSGYNLNDEALKRKFERTAKLLKLDIKDSPYHPRPHHYLGISYLEQSMYSQAIVEAETAIHFYENYGYSSDLYWGSYHVLSTALMKTGNLEKAEYWSLRGLKNCSHNLDSLFNLSTIYYKKHELSQFWKYINKYLDLLKNITNKPGNYGTMIFHTSGYKWLAHFYKATIYLDENQREKGEKDFNLALKCCRDKAFCYHLMARYFQKKEEWKKAEQTYLKGLEESPQNTELIWDFAQFYKQTNDRDNQIKWLTKLRAAQPENVTPLFEIGLSYLKKNDFNRAVSFFKQVLELDEKHIKAKINLALSLRKSGDFNKAILYSQAVVKEYPASLPALSNLAYSYYDLNDYDNAAKYFIKMVQIDPDQLDPHVYLSLLFLLKQDIESCTAQCDHLLRLLNLKRDIVLYSLDDLGSLFESIANKMLSMNKKHLSEICLNIGQVLTASTPAV